MSNELCIYKNFTETRVHTGMSDIFLCVYILITSTWKSIDCHLTATRYPKSDPPMEQPGIPLLRRVSLHPEAQVAARTRP